MATDHALLATPEDNEKILGMPPCGRAIPESEAWRIAMTWSHSLSSSMAWRQRVRLKTEATSSAPFAVVSSYTWVKLKIDSQADAAVARAATLTWFWLASCRGYSGRENPRFWKRVFAELQSELPYDDLRSRSSPATHTAITDATRFFDHWDFPRIRLIIGDVDVGSVYRGLDSNDSTTRLLTTIQARLCPHMCPDRLRRLLPVRIEIRYLDAIPNTLTTLREISALFLSGWIVQPCIKSVLVHAWVRYLPYAQRLCLADPRLMIKTLELSGNDNLQHLTNLQPLFEVTKSSKTSRGLRVHTLCLRRESLPMTLLASVCSALPHTRAFSVLRIMAPSPHTPYVSRNRGYRIKGLHVRPFEAIDWAWIGYALFHPDTPNSTWHSLDMNVDSITPEAMQVLRLVARGNNLVAVEEGGSQTQTSSFYHVVQLQCKTRVYNFPAVYADVLYETEASVSACACANTSKADDVVPYDWIRIVAPGHGFGWIHASSITKRESCPPSASSLRGLRVHATTPSQVPTALDFVALFGASLQQLDMVNCGALDAIQLHRLLLVLPSLRSLTVKHDSTLWSVPLDPTWTLRLKELSMTLEGDTLYPPHPNVLETVLRELKALRVITQPQCFDQNRTATLEYVNALPKLTYLHWSTTGRPNGTYRHGRATAQQKLGGSITVARMARCRRAFLSVLRTRRVASLDAAVGRLVPDVCALVFSFVPPWCGVDLWIDA